MTFRLSSTGSGQLLKNCASLVVPVTPPSALAPLSEITMINVLSSSPDLAQELDQSPDVVIGVG